MYDPYADFTIHSLSNGVPVFVFNEPRRSFAYVDIIIHAGMRDDVFVPCGTAHFLEHIVCANSGKSLNEIHQYFGGVGGDFNAVTSFYATRYGFMAPIDSKEFQGGLSFWADACFVNPHTQHFEREMGIILSELKRDYQSNALMNFREKIARLHFRDLPYGQAARSSGTIETVSCITETALEEYRKKFYHTGNISIVCVGGIEPMKLLAMLEKTALGAISERNRNSLPKLCTRFTPLTENNLEEDLSTGIKLGQANLEFRTLFPGDVSAESLEIASGALSESLYDELREKRGLAYQMGVSTYNHGPFHEMTVGVRAFDESKVSEVRAIVEGTLTTCGDDVRLMEAVKKRMLASYLTKDRTIKQISGGAVGEISRFGQINSDASERQQYELVTRHDMQKVAEHFTQTDQVLKVVAYV